MRPRADARAVGRELGLVRGVVAERVAIGTPLDPFLGLRALARYGGLSVRKLREYLRAPVNPLPHYRVGGKVLVRVSDYDRWMLAFRARADARIDVIVDEVVRTLRPP